MINAIDSESQAGMRSRAGFVSCAPPILQPPWPPGCPAARIVLPVQASRLSIHHHP